jgi:hypothetical protein
VPYVSESWIWGQTMRSVVPLIVDRDD